jgi:hypothetical protein
VVQAEGILPEGLSGKKGEDIITFVDEFLYLSYAKSTW